MKTYKLIKTYPGSFPLGHLAILDESVKYYNLGTTTRSLDYIENHPENWQHVCYKCHENVNTCKTFGCKQAILITEDGKEFFDDSSTVYYVNKTNLRIIPVFIKSLLKKDFLINALNDKYFGCINAANKYAEENKPKVKLFTTEDGVDIFEGDSFVVISLIDVEESTVESEVIMKPYDIWEKCKLYGLITNKTGNFLAFSTKKSSGKLH